MLSEHTNPIFLADWSKLNVFGAWVAAAPLGTDTRATLALPIIEGI